MQPSKSHNSASFHVTLLLMAAGIGLGAFGAHGLEEILKRHQRLETWHTAVFYHLIHGLAMFALTLKFTHRPLSWWLWLGGIAFFSGSLYTLSLTNLTWLGAITPIGGVLFIAGWLVLWRQKIT